MYWGKKLYIDLKAVMSTIWKDGRPANMSVEWIQSDSFKNSSKLSFFTIIE